MKIATWNVNSLRARLPHVSAWLTDAAPDVVCLQETKVQDADFPAAAFAALDYQVVFSGQRSYNGVAIAARAPLTAVSVGLPGFADDERRVICATYQDVRVISVYVPNGTAPDSPRFHYKLAWLEAFTAFVRDNIAHYPQLVIAGDFNIAPTDADVYDPAAWVGSVLVTDAERAAFRGLLACGLTDAFAHAPRSDCGYSWWDYRALAFRRNHGLRIDHVLLSADLAGRCDACYPDRGPRAQPRPSDHTPVVVECRSAGA
ncbi:MAG: exodeoxyribonuclease III [Acidiferrobacter sp.]